jgi:bifunctional UDP-N-acetylglucosamine pyrophosphorylase/glucosamine-1-phosphate N-acetyltransferase
VDLHVVVLAAGKGTRMKSAQPKVLHRVAGLPMIDYVLATSAALAPRSTTVVVGHQADVLRQALAAYPNVDVVLQEPQLGTGHALLQTEPGLRGATGTLVLLSGDVPLLTIATLKTLVAHHIASRAAATVLTAVVDEPSGYGRVVRSDAAGAQSDGAGARSGAAGGQLIRIVEEKDASAAEREIREVNSGIYAFALEGDGPDAPDGLFRAVREIGTENASGEHYLPDLVTIYRRHGRTVSSVSVRNPDEIRGINSRSDLATVSRIMRDQKAAELMAAGVTVEDPATAYIDRDVTVGADTVLHPNVSLEGTTTIGAGCEIHSGTRIVDSQIGDGAIVLNHCVLAGARVGTGARIGPFAHLRKDADVRDGARVGNFVELKNTVLGARSKSMHLAYLGDARIGEGVNVGAGTITCNYDGERKQQTVIKDGAFIGSDSQLIAPVTIGEQAYIGSGSTIRENVPDGALAVSAGKQRNIDNWVGERKKKRASTSSHKE